MTFCPTCYIINIADGSIAQLGEHLPYKQRVTGSSPVVPTKIKRIPYRYPFYFYVIRCNARNCDKILQILRTREQRIWEKQFGELFCSIFVSYKSPVQLFPFCLWVRILLEPVTRPRRRKFHIVQNNFKLFFAHSTAPPLKICRTAVRRILYYF